MSKSKLTKRNTKRIMKGGRRNRKTLNRKNKTKNKHKGGATMRDIGILAYQSGHCRDKPDCICSVRNWSNCWWCRQRHGGCGCSC